MSKTSTETIVAPPEPQRLMRIEAINLFDLYTYDLDLTNPRTEGTNHVTLMYGGNGSGKTSILKLVYHLLSPAPQRGHLLGIAEVPFSEVHLTLYDGTRISATRQGNSRGSFTLSCAFATNQTISIPVVTNPDGGVLNLNELMQNIDYVHYQDRLQQLKFGVYMLSDDRLLRSDRLQDQPGEGQATVVYNNAIFPMGVIPQQLLTQRQLETAQAELRNALNRARNWAQSQYNRASDAGTESVNRIYDHVVEAIVNTEPDEETTDARIMSSRIRTIEHRTRTAQRYNLSGPFQPENILKAIRKRGLTASKRDILAHVLMPYLDALDSRLNQIHPTQVIMDTFVNHVNRFFTDKRVTFTVGEGVKITSSNGDRVIPPEHLSSGERHLLLLMTNVLATRDTPAIFIVDEPEISLNVAWQRDLVTALLACAREARIQFLMATHSVEILAKSRKAVVNLDPVQSARNEA